MRYGGFWVRFWATGLDYCLIIVILIVPQIVIETKTRVSPDESIILLILSSVIQWLYFSCFESSRWQATPGKRLFGLRVSDLTGGRITFMHATGRWFAKILSTMVLLIGYIMVGLTDKKQGLHDKIANTLVLRGKAGEGQFRSVALQRVDEDTRNTMVVPASNAGRWVMAGFDEQGHVIRLTFDHHDSKLNAEGLIIGRDARICDLHLPDQSASRRHARLFGKAGAIWIEDLGSTNGIVVDGRLVPKGGSVELPLQGTIVVGAVELSVGKY